MEFIVYKEVFEFAVAVEQKHYTKQSIQELYYYGAHRYLTSINQYSIEFNGKDAGEAFLYSTRDGYYYLMIDMLDGRYAYIDLGHQSRRYLLKIMPDKIKDTYKLCYMDVEVETVDFSDADVY